MKVVDRVASILEYDPPSRSSDKRLFVIFMQKFGLDLSPEQIRKFYAMPSFESIRRRRQLLQEKGLYPADKSVNEDRYRKYKAVRGGEMRLETVAEKPKVVYVPEEWT